VRPQFVVVDQPVIRDLLHQLDGLEQVGAQDLLAICFVEALDVGVLVGLAGFDKSQSDTSASISSKRASRRSS
jgi:hypothetical protein